MRLCFWEAVAAVATCAIPGCCAKSDCGVFDVTDYGAVGDAVTPSTEAVRTAALAVAAAGGGTLLFPRSAGGRDSVYLTGAFNVTSHTRVVIESGVTVLGSTNGSDWPLLVTREVWPQMGRGSDCAPGSESCRLMHQALLFAWRAVNVTVSGGGAIDCNARAHTWWHCARDLSVPPCSGYSRPHCLMLSSVTDVEVSNLTVTNSPSWTLHFSSVTNLHVHHVNVTNPMRGAPNADGIDIDSTQNALVEDSYFSVGDDALCVKSGIDFFGRTYGRPSKDILFRRNTIGTGHGITIGSEMSGGVSNVTFEDIFLNNTQTGVRMKSMRGRGGTVHDVTYRRILLEKIVGQCVQVTLHYHPADPTNATATPTFKNVLLEDIRCVKASASYLLDGLPERHILNLKLKNVTMGSKVMGESGCENVGCSCDPLTWPCPSCCRQPGMEKQLVFV